MSVCVVPSAVFVSSASGAAAVVPLTVVAVVTCDASTSYMLSQTEFNILTAGSVFNPDVVAAQLVLFAAFMGALAVMFGLKQVYRLLVPSSGVGHE
jgi:hypothetical protein